MGVSEASDLEDVMAFPTSVNDQITDSVTQQKSKARQMIEVIEASERGEKIEYRSFTGWAPWVPPWFNFCGFEYRIAKLEPKKIKLKAYLPKNQTASLIFNESDLCEKNYRRVPQFDCEVEE